MHAIILIEANTILCGLFTIKNRSSAPIMHSLTPIDCSLDEGVLYNPFYVHRFFKQSLESYKCRSLTLSIIIGSESLFVVQEKLLIVADDSLTSVYQEKDSSPLWGWDYSMWGRNSDARYYIYRLGIRLSFIMQLISAVQGLPLVCELITSQIMILAHYAHKKNPLRFKKILDNYGENCLEPSLFIDDSPLLFFVPSLYRHWIEENTVRARTLESVITWIT